jgi:hypothetical protein
VDMLIIYIQHMPLSLAALPLAMSRAHCLPSFGLSDFSLFPEYCLGATLALSGGSARWLISNTSQFRFPSSFSLHTLFPFPCQRSIAGTLLAVSLLTVVSVARVASPITSYTATFDLVS